MDVLYPVEKTKPQNGFLYILLSAFISFLDKIKQILQDSSCYIRTKRNDETTLLLLHNNNIV